MTAAAAERSGRRRALLLACGEYDDPTIPRLRSPARDARELAAVLGDPTRGRYEVRTEVDCTHDEAQMAIEAFFAAGRRDDLLLLYLSCHGILDSRGELHLAFRTTRQGLLQSTALSRGWVHARLDESRAQSLVVLVDCCFSGAFVYGGMRARAAARPVDVDGLVRDPPPGKVRAVLTASSSTQLSFEDEAGRAEAAARPSYFTEAVLAGLSSGAADRDRDGRISVEDLYSFVYDRVVRGPSGQQPQRSLHGGGDLPVAYAGAHQPEPPLPPEPPDSDLTVLIKPDLPLPPWPPPPGSGPAGPGANRDAAGPWAAPRPRLDAGRPQPAAYGPVHRAHQPHRVPPAQAVRVPAAAPRAERPVAGPWPSDRPRSGPALAVLLVGLLLVAGLVAGGIAVLPRILGRGDDAGSGTARLAEPKAATAGVLTLTVTGLRVGSKTTEVDLKLTNRASRTATLPKSFCTLSEAGGSGHSAKPFEGTWTEQVPPGSTQTGTVVFAGAVAVSTTRVTVSFGTVFGGPDFPSGITVRDVVLRPG